MSHDKINRSEIISTLFFHHIDKGSIKKENPLLYVSAYSLIIIFVLRFNDSSLVDIYVIVSYLEISTLQLIHLFCSSGLQQGLARSRRSDEKAWPGKGESGSFNDGHYQYCKSNMSHIVSKPLSMCDTFAF